MECESLLVPISISLLMTYVLASAYAGPSIYALALLCIVPLPFAFFISLSIIKTRKLIEDKDMLEEFVEKICTIAGTKTATLPMNKRIRQTVLYCRDARLKEAFRLAASLSRLGYPVHIAIVKAHGKLGRVGELTRSIPIEVGATTFLSNLAVQYGDKMQVLSSTIASRLQRYSTANMFVSTIIPSFVIFGFIGDLVISQKSIGISALVVIMNLIIPFLYALSNFTMYRGLLE